MEGRKSRSSDQKCQAVSEVYGQMLMVVVTIILVASLVYPNIPESAPRANLLIEARNFTQNATTSTQDENTPTQDTPTSGGYLIKASSGPGGSISPAGNISVPAGDNKIFSMKPDKNYKVLDVLVDGASIGPVSSYTFNNVSKSHSIQASFTVDFYVVNNNTVVPKGNFAVNATVLGCAFTRGAGPSPITCRLKLGKYTYDPWGDYTNPSKGNINDKKNPRFWGSNISKAGTSVTVDACSWEYNKWDKILTVSTSTNPSNLKVLKNGDPVPNIPGFQGQDSIEDFVKGHIENGSIKLKENEAIYLFELGNTNLNSIGADFQDLVVLISINGTDTLQSAVESQEVVYSNDSSNDTPNDTPNSTPNNTQNNTQNEAVSKLIIEHLGGDTINFKSFNETKVILQTGDGQHYLNSTELGVLKSGDRVTLVPIDYETDEQLYFSQGETLSIKIVDVPSKSLIYSGSTTVK